MNVVGEEKSLDRSEFIFALFSLAKAKYCDEQDRSYNSSTALSLEAGVEKLVTVDLVPVLQKLGDGLVRKELHTNAVQMVLQKFMVNLNKVYMHYAQSDQNDNMDGSSESSGEKKKPMLNLAEFNVLVKDSGLMGGISNNTGEDDEADGVDALTMKEVRMAFAGAQDDGGYIDHTDDSTSLEARLDNLHKEETQMVFHEFIEAIVRIAFAKWVGDIMPPKQKITLAVEAIADLAKSLHEVDMSRFTDIHRKLGNQQKRKNGCTSPNARVLASLSAPSFF